METMHADFNAPRLGLPYTKSVPDYPFDRLL